MALKRSRSFRTKILILFLVGYSFVIGALVFYSLYLNYSYQQSIRQTGNAMLDLYVNELDDLLDRSDLYLLKTVTQNVYASVLQSPNATAVDKYSAVYDLNQELDSELTLEKGIAGFVTIYNDETFYYTFQNTIRFDDKQAIGQFVDDGTSSPGVLKEWKVVRCDSMAFLVLTYNVRGTYITVVVDFEAVTSDLVNKYSPGKTQIVFTDGQGLLDNRKTAPGIALAMSDDGSRLVVDSKGYIPISKKIDSTDLTMNILVPDGSTTAIQWSQVYAIWILLLAFGCALASYLYIHAQLIRPINRMTGTMKTIMDGQLDARMPEQMGIVEYEQTGRTFNSMMGQIKELKIRSYEDEIEVQKSRRQYLQLQIKPHFYLNGLKTLYALLQQQKYKELENVIIDTSRFLRYIFLDIFTLVTVNEELTFTQNYIDMQKGNVLNGITCEISADASAIEERILPLTIQTFVENSIKHAQAAEGLVLKIRVNRLEGEEADFLDIVVSDNGQGYSEEWPEQMGRQEEDGSESEHIGIVNLKKRIQLQYGEKAEFVLRNDQGAISEVILPIEKSPVRI